MKLLRLSLASALLLTSALLQAGDAGATLYTVDSQLKPKAAVSAAKIDGFIRYKKADSPLIGLGQAWVDAGNKYDVNAVYLFSHAILESGWGTSQIATDKKNIYGYGAYDRDPYGYAMAFNSFQECIDYVTGKINANYLTPGGAYYNGATLRGMNVRYATDPNWGSKIAGIMNLFADPIGAYPAAVPPSGFPGIASSDAVAVYNYGSGTSAIWNFRTVSGRQGLTLAPYVAWLSGPQGLDPVFVKFVTGDFNGDGVTDLIGLYDYGGQVAAFWLWKGKSNGALENPVKVFYMPSWEVSQTKLVSGDFDGDGKNEVMAFYSYGGTKVGVYLFKMNASGVFDNPRQIFYSPYWDWGRTTLLSMKAGSRADVVAAYNYGGTEMGLWQFGLDANGNLIYPQRVFYSPYWDYSRSTFLAGDVNGDGYGDIVAVYNYGGTSTGVFTFYRTDATGASYSYPRMAFHSPYWAYARSSFLAGDFNRDGASDLLAFYDYGGGRTAAWLFGADGSSLRYPSMIYETPFWDNARTTWLKSSN
ncbi:MAG: glucosaminidase domain-containing protein [Actinobacteria bacterium]|nr:glucosaminidase domain-containing protein [Actinomycetota bacterium]